MIKSTINKSLLSALVLCLLFAIACSPTKKMTADHMNKETMTEENKMKKDFRSIVPEAGPAPTIQLGDYTSFQLQNGLTVVVVENHKLPKVNFRLLVDADIMHEGDKSGLAEFTGSLLSRGTSSMTKAEIDESVDYIGARLNSSSYGLFGSSLSIHKDKLLKIMSDMIYRPSFSNDELDKLKTQRISALQSSKNDPNQISAIATSTINYGTEHPYGVNTSEESVNNISIDDIKNYYKTYWRPNESYLAVVGDITEADAKALAIRYFGDWKSEAVPSHTYKVPEKPAKTRVCFINKPSAVQSVIRITQPLELLPKDKDVFAVKVMNDILGGGAFSGYLMQNLREDKAYTYGAGSSLNSDKLVGTFSANASVRNEVTDSAIVEFFYEINRIRTELVSDEHLSLIKNSTIGSFARSLEQPNVLASRVLGININDLPLDYYETYLENINKVTKEDVLRVAQKYINPDRMNIVVVGNEEEVASKLSRFAADGKVQYFDTDGLPRKEVTLKIDEALTARNVVSNYLNAIGGKSKLQGTKSVVNVGEAEVMGQTMETTTTNVGKNVSISTKMSGNEMMSITVTPDDVVFSQMGQTIPLQDQDKSDIRDGYQLFPELNWSDDQLSLGKAINIDGENAIPVSLTKPDGSKVTIYYSLDTYLKLKDVAVSGEGEQAMTISNVYGDYKEVGGIKFPHTVESTGMMPIPIVMKVKSIVVDGDVDMSIFE